MTQHDNDPGEDGRPPSPGLQQAYDKRVAYLRMAELLAVASGAAEDVAYEWITYEQSPNVSELILISSSLARIRKRLLQAGLGAPEAG
ncbi:MAG: hypothetical protein AAFY65_08255 [Pseudomonadota bacterium]